MNLQKHKQNGGFAVVLAMIAIMGLSFFLLTGVSTTTTTLKISGNYTRTVDSFNIAEVGLAKARPIIEATDFSVLLAGATGPDGVELISETPFNEGSYRVFISDNDDGDGNWGVDSDSIIIARSIGTNAAGGTVQIDAHLQKVTSTTTQPFPAEPSGGAGASMMCGVSSDVQTQGAAKIRGEDYAVPDVTCSGAGCNGVDCSNPSNIYSGGPCEGICGFGVTCPKKAAVVAQGPLNTAGGGYTGATPVTRSNVGDTGCEQWLSLRDQLASLDTSSPYVEVLTGSGTNTNLNTCADPKVFIINTPSPTYTIGGNGGLCGILVVASNTSVNTTGTSTVIGVVLVMGGSADLSFVASSGTPNFFGQVIVDSRAADRQKELIVKGNTSIKYSTQGIGYANQAMNNALNGGGGGGGSGGLITMAWKETY